MIVFPFSSRKAFCMLTKQYGSGKSSGSSFQSIFFVGVTSRVRMSCIPDYGVDLGVAGYFNKLLESAAPVLRSSPQHWSLAQGK